MGKFLVAFLVAGMVAATPAPNTEYRAEFRALLTEFVAAGELSCSESTLNQQAKPISYSLSLEDEPNYQDAYFVRFTSGQSNWSTLVAYEGYNGHMMGRLDKEYLEDKVIYEHVFDGYYDDTLRVSAIDGRISQLSYEKIGPGGVVAYTLKCLPGKAR